MVSDPVLPFYEIVRNRDNELATLASAGNKLIGYFCTYTPVELIHASGFVPVRIMGEADTIDKAYTLTPDFICPYLRKAVEKGLNGDYQCLSGVVQGYTCDGACGVANIWEENIGADVFHIVPLPYVDQPDSRSFLRAELMDVIEKLRLAGGSYSAERLTASLDLYGKVRTLMTEFYALRYERKLPLSAADFLYVVQAGFFTPPERYYTMLTDLKKVLPHTFDPPKGIPVLISGSLIEEPEIFRILEESGGVVVADDLCTGLRNFIPPYGQGADPLDRLIDRTMNRFPCPSRASAEVRLPRLLELMDRSKARVVVFIFQRFCTPHLGDHPFLNAALKERRIPSMMVEIEESGTMEGQMRTRFEGFFEMLEA